DSDSDSDSDGPKKLTNTNNSFGNSAGKKTLPSTGAEDNQLLYSVAGLGMVGLGLTFYGGSKKKKKGSELSE
ncbi:LPXTG cell wall anchor domain-containing protein, partial [Enterococcus pallens]